MVGWNVAATELVAGQASSQDKCFLCLNLCNCNCFNELYEHVECFEWTNFASTVDCIMHMYMFMFNAFLLCQCSWGLVSLAK